MTNYPPKAPQQDIFLNKKRLSRMHGTNMEQTWNRTIALQQSQQAKHSKYKACPETTHFPHLFSPQVQLRQASL